jgi:magnesium transporter
MIHTYTYNDETWIDVDSGTPEEIHSLMDTYGIHPFVAKELTSATRKPRIELHDGYIYCILHFPAFKHSHAADANQEVDFIIGKNLLITARYDTIDSLDTFGKTIEVKEVLGKNVSSTDSQNLLFFGLLRELYNGMTEELDSIEDITDDITARIFAGSEREMVVQLSLVTRTLLEFKKEIDLHRDVLDSLHHYGKKMFGEEWSDAIEAIMIDYLKIMTNIHSELDMLRELRETNNSLLTSKQNETVKQLTIIGALVLPLNLIAVFFAMRLTNMPIVNNPNAFWIVVVLMLASVAITLTYIKHKKWL